MRSVAYLLVFFSLSAWSASGVKGVVSSSKECGEKVMVWLSLDKENYKERLLLLQSEVPVGGSFQFNLKPGSYQIRGTDEKDCEYLQRIKISNSVINVTVKMEKR